MTVFLKHIHIVIAVSFRPAIYFGMSAKNLTFLNCTELFICEKNAKIFSHSYQYQDLLFFAHDIFTCRTRMMDMGNLKFERDILVQ